MECLLKFIARDFSLFSSQWRAHTLYESSQENLGVTFKDFIAVNQGQITQYYDVEKDFKAIGKAIVDKLNYDDAWYPKLSQQYRLNVENARKILVKLKKEKSLNVENFNLLKVAFRGLDPGLRFCAGIPNAWREHIEKNVKNYENIFAAAYKDKVESEGIFEELESNYVRLMGNTLNKMGKLSSFAKLMTIDEIYLTLDGKDINWKEVEKRANGYVYCKGKVYATQNYKEVFKKNNYTYKEIQVSKNELNGVPTYIAGKVTGIVKVVYNAEKIDEFPQGFILVTPMTTPDFVPLMKKAAAIITDEGGITCHAAIVSRELGVPCIIGTKNATSILKNGDLVEVDTIKGKVKILKSH